MSTSENAGQCKITLNIKEAHDLLAKDACGTSDPYVKIKLDGATIYRTRTIMKQLDPVWNEACELILEHLGQKVTLSVYDYDRGSISDDFLGQADIDLLKPEFDKVVEHNLELVNKGSSNKGTSKYRGFIIVTSKVERLAETRESEKASEDSPQKGSSFTEVAKPAKRELGNRQSVSNQPWCQMLEIVIGNVRDIHIPGSALAKSPQFHLRIGYSGDWRRTKPKPVPTGSSGDGSLRGVLRIGEDFTFHIKENKLSDLLIEIWQSGSGLVGDSPIDRLRIDVHNLAIDQTHKFRTHFSNKCAAIRMTVTLTGTRPDVLASLGGLQAPTWSPDGPPLISQERLRGDEDIWLKQLKETFALRNFQQLSNDTVGVLVLRVIQGQKLMAADIGGKSDPFVCIEIVNVRLRTHIEYKTLSPKWNRIFIIPIRDIHSVMTLTVFDDDGDAKPDFLGKLSIPILRFEEIQGERRWFALKSRLNEPSTSRGSIELEGHLFYNQPLAILRTLDPKEASYLAKEPKIGFADLQRDLDFANKLFDQYYRVLDSVRNLMSWKDPKITLAAIFAWILTCHFSFYFELRMAPFALAIAFIFTYALNSLYPNNSEDDSSFENFNEASNDEEKVSLLERMNKLQEMGFFGHRALEAFTSFYERLRNILLWRSPWISSFAMVTVLLVFIFCSIFPLRYLMMALGVYELTKAKIRPNAGFEIYDIISRAYTDSELMKFRETKQLLAK